MYGRRGSICAHLGWSWDYLHHGIAWSVVQRIMADLPYYEFDSESKGDGADKMRLNSENADAIMNHINSLL